MKPLPGDTPEVSEHMAFLIKHDFNAALRQIAKLECDSRRIEIVDDPGLAPNIRIDADDEGEFCWKIGDDCYPTFREAIDSINEDQEEEDSNVG